MLNTVFKSTLFAGQIALVTGGGTGIGLRTARELAHLGATPILAGRKKENLDKAVELILQEGGTAYAVICNIREEQSIKDCIQQSLDYAGTIDLLVNNAGGQFPAPAETISRKGWRAVIETNLDGSFFVTQEVFNRVFKEKGGAVVNVLANMRNGMPMMSHTGAARSGVDNLTKSLAVEWGRYGVRINSVAPGPILSSGLDTYAKEFRSFIDATAKNNQAQRLGSMAEVAAAILFLLSPAASYITGQTLFVDAGESLYNPIYPPVAHNKLSTFKDEEK